MSQQNTEKCILVDGSHPEELRVAIVTRLANSKYHLDNLHMQRATQMSSKGNIYGGISTTLVESLNAAFVDIGSTRHAFLPQKEIASEYFKKSNADLSQRTSITDLIKENQKILVQVEKDERGNKGAALTTFISLAGCYLVLMPNNPKAGGISRRIEGEERDELKAVLEQLDVPEGMGLIVRTAGVGKSIEELQWDLSVLLKQWEAIQNAAKELGDSPALVYQESNIVVRTIRDYLRDDIDKIITNDQQIFQELQQSVQMLKPEFADRVMHYQDKVPLFNRYQVEGQIETAYQREVRLPSGGSIVIDHTEALVSIDVNSSRATRGSDIEETALQTNLEAADEIARQLRLRDIGGLLVIDFIDMTPIRNQREVENRLREALKQDRARVQIGRISRFGLLEMSRQRLAHSLSERTKVVCPRCKGQGTIRSVDSMAISMLRLIEEEAIKIRRAGRHDRVLVQLPVNVSSFLTNEKRDDLMSIEQEYRISVFIIPNNTMETPHYIIKSKASSGGTYAQPSYKMAEAQDSEQYTEDAILGHDDGQVETPMVSTVMMPATPRKEGGLLKRIIGSLLGADDKPKQEESEQSERSAKSGQNRGGARQADGRRQNTRSGNKNSNNNRRKRPQKKQQGQGQNRSEQGSQRRQDDKSAESSKPAQSTKKSTNQRARRDNRDRDNRDTREKKSTANKAVPAQTADQYESQPPLDFQEPSLQQPVLTSHELGASISHSETNVETSKPARERRGRHANQRRSRQQRSSKSERSEGSAVSSSVVQSSEDPFAPIPKVSKAPAPAQKLAEGDKPNQSPVKPSEAKSAAPQKETPKASAPKPVEPKKAEASPAAEQKTNFASDPNWQIPPEYKSQRSASSAAKSVKKDLTGNSAENSKESSD